MNVEECVKYEMSKGSSLELAMDLCATAVIIESTKDVNKGLGFLEAKERAKRKKGT